MDENPYRAPAGRIEPKAANSHDWATTLRRWAIGPTLPLGWILFIGAITVFSFALIFSRLIRH